MRSEAAIDALLVTIKTSAIANALILARRNSGRVRDRVAQVSRAGRSRSRSSSCRSCYRPPSPESGCSPRSAAAACSATTHGARGLAPVHAVAVVLAVTFVASPFYIRAAVAAFEAVDPHLPAAARTLGASPARTFPHRAAARGGGLGAGWALAFARGIGEFGATIMFAGNVQGVTQTLSLAIYEQSTSPRRRARDRRVLVIVSAAILLVVKLLPSWTRSSSASTTLFAPSRSV